MDHLSFVFSFLLIVYVTATIGSVINAKNPNREELEALLKRSYDAQAKLKEEKSSRDEDSETSKRIGELRSNLQRTVTISLENENTDNWEDPSVFFESGTAEGSLLSPVPEGSTVHYKPRKTYGTARGAVGVFAYYIPSMQKTLAVLWCVPFGFAAHQNWWNVKLYNGNEEADYDMYYDLYYESDPFGPNKEEHKVLGFGLEARGYMSDSGVATLDIHVTKVM